MKNKKESTPPTDEQLKQWLSKDLQAAHYLLGSIIMDPELLERVSERFIAHVREKERKEAEL